MFVSEDNVIYVQINNMFVSEDNIIYVHQHVMSAYAYHLLYKNIRTTSYDFPQGQLVQCIGRVP